MASDRLEDFGANSKRKERGEGMGEGRVGIGKYATLLLRVGLLLSPLPVARLGSASAAVSVGAGVRVVPRAAARALDAALADACSEVSSPERQGSSARRAAERSLFRLNFGKNRGKLICEVSKQYAQVSCVC